MKPLVFLSAGEASGDKLAAELARELKRQRGDEVRFAGIGGEAMKAAGVDVIEDYQPLAVMGYKDALLNLPKILSLRRRARQWLAQTPPALFVGVDAPDFNLPLAAGLRARGIKTAQYVAPSVWMWRRWRLKKISRAVDEVWCLLPFEKDIYRDAGIAAVYVGHPAARRRFPGSAAARQRLGIADGATVVALLPGSRDSELRRHLPIFAPAMKRLKKETGATFAVAATDAAAREAMITALPGSVAADLDDVLAAADVAVVKSGTVTLETAMAGTPMVAVYSAPQRAKWFFRAGFFSLPYFTLPNILARRFVVSELMLEDLSADNIARETLRLLESEERRARQREVFAVLRDTLAAAEESAATAAGRLLPC